jgi:hypothetical protein
MKNLQQIQKNFEESWRPEGCDAEHPSVYMNSEGKYICRCIVCARCHRHTGNNNQGHYWAMCNVLLKSHVKHKTKSVLDCRQCLTDLHFCCPSNCELFNEDGSKK